ncbi:MAG TPA: hypothetical protein VF613_11300, partial [Longimicrobium sp.]|jgi:hypothetical protein
VYSLGVVGYQLLTGQKPFDSERTAATGADLKPIRSINPQVPAALEAVIERAMDPDPARRFPDADAFAAALDGAAEPDDSETLIATSAPPIVDDERTVIAPDRPRVAAAAIPVAVSAEPAPLPRRDPAPVPPPRAKKRGWMVALPLLALGGVAGVWALSGDGGGGTEGPAPADSAETRPASPTDEEVPVTLPADTFGGDPGAAQGEPTEDPGGGEGQVQVTPVPINPNAGGGDPPPFSPPAAQRPAPAQQQPAQQQPAQQRPAPVQRPAPRPPRPVPQPREQPRVEQPQPQPQPPAPQPQPQPLPPQPQPQPLPPSPQPQPQPPPPTPYPAPRDTIVIPSRPVPLPVPMTPEAPRK